MTHNDPESNGPADLDAGSLETQDPQTQDAQTQDPQTQDPDSTSPDDGGFVVTAVAGLAAMGVSMAARPVLNAVYRQVTGSTPPRAEDPLVPFGRALAWTIASAVTGAVLEMVVQRTTRRLFGVRA